jgi:hypothetical protein
MRAEAESATQQKYQSAGIYRLSRAYREANIGLVTAMEQLKLVPRLDLGIQRISSTAKFILSIEWPQR